MKSEIIVNADDIERLYGEDDCKVMRIAGETFKAGNSRVDEIKAFAKSSGYKKIGIANCIVFQKQADQLKEMLSDEFEVHSVNCKTGQLPRSEFLGEGSKGLSCNPAGQAEELAGRSTELNISFGLCMGHDILFNTKSKAPVTTLVVKDRKYKHNPFEHFADDQRSSGE